MVINKFQQNEGGVVLEGSIKGIRNSFHGERIRSEKIFPLSYLSYQFTKKETK